METIKDYAIAPKKGRRSYYWIWAIINGKLFVDGPHSTPDEAYTVGYEKVKHFSEVISLPTKSLAAATQAVKHNRLESTGNVETAMRRAKHKI